MVGRCVHFTRAFRQPYHLLQPEFHPLELHRVLGGDFRSYFDGVRLADLSSVTIFAVVSVTSAEIDELWSDAI